MATNFFKVRNGLSLGNLPSAPSNPQDGDIYYDTTLNSFQGYADGSWGPIGGSGGNGTGDDLGTLDYLVSLTDSFDNPPVVDGIINTASGFTDPNIYDAANKYYRMSYDASQTVTGSGTSMTISGTPSFTVKVGDMLIVGSEARRITVVTSQTLYTIEAAFSTNPAAAACCISQAIYSVDLNNYAGDGLAPSALYTDTVSSVLMDYSDSLTAGDVIPDFGVTPNVAFSASSDNSSFSPVTVRTTNITDTDQSVSLPAASTGLYVRFFANKTSGSGAVNLLRYKAFFHRQSFQDQGFTLNQSYAMSDGTGVAINCSLSVVSSKTRISLIGYLYTPALNPGTTNGQLEILINGQKIPRFVDATTTPDSYYKEINSFTIELDSDYSGYNFSLEVIKPLAVVDTSSSNALKLINIYDAIVGSSIQLSAGQATHTSLTAALTAVDPGSRILLLNLTTTENVTISQNVTIEGRGHASILQGTLTFATGSDYSTVRDLKIGDNVTINSGPTGIFFTNVWLASGKTVTDNSTGNYKVWIGE